MNGALADGGGRMDRVDILSRDEEAALCELREAVRVLRDGGRLRLESVEELLRRRGFAEAGTADAVPVFRMGAARFVVERPPSDPCGVQVRFLVPGA